ncbi:MAG: pullulanase [Halanaerobium sp.]
MLIRRQKKLIISALILFLVFFTPLLAAETVPDGHLRIHFQNSSQNYENLGLWLWQDVAEWSEEKGAWPDGAEDIEGAERDDYGPYLDVELVDNPEEIGFLINNAQGENLSGDLIVEILSENMDEIWLREKNSEYNIHLTEPIKLPENTVRIYFKNNDNNYEDWGIWKWGDVAQISENEGEWPTAASLFPEDQISKHGTYLDIKLKDDAEQINFLAVNTKTGEQTADMNISNLDDKQLFIHQDLDKVYKNPYYSSDSNLITARLLDSKIELRFSTTDGLSVQDLDENLSLINKWKVQPKIENIKIVDQNTVELYGAFHLEDAPYQIVLGDKEYDVVRSWRLIDQKYSYDGELGPQLNKDGSASLKIWSPEAESVALKLYDKDDQYQVLKENLEMEKNNKGVWELTLNNKNTGIENLEGYYYHYLVEHDGKTNLALDPYAPSMAAWKYHPSDEGPEYKSGKAAIVDPAAVGPELDYPEIDNFEKSEDAIIYEVHVRDLTSDPAIAEELESQFGTFAAFKEKLDYIEDLGVTHIQLLPVMSYYFGDVTANDQRLLEYSSANNNYNWGYDPHSYFSLSGMYSENPKDPVRRIEEFKELVAEIHSRDMGVILDVVFNHTARVHLFEDLMPNYYHFMKLDGSAKTSFGGGRLATTHKMSRKLMVDSIAYWVDEFKVDGFRFDMMGDHDAESIEMAYQKAKELNPNILMIGEGWRTYEGDDLYPDVRAADQDWMQYTDTVASFSDDYRNMIKSGFGAEAEPRFVTGGEVNIERIISNIKAQPLNFEADDPGDVVTYVESHDNMTVHDVIAIATESDPDKEETEIQQRLRLANLMVLTSQGRVFLHAGQEYGRTKQFRTETQKIPPSSFVGLNKEGQEFKYPYFIDDSYDSTDAVNMIEWEKIYESKTHQKTVDYTKGLIKLRQSDEVFQLAEQEEIEQKVKAIKSSEIKEDDLAVAYQLEGDNYQYFIFVNADNKSREISTPIDLRSAEIIVDQSQAGTAKIEKPIGLKIFEDSIQLEALTGAVIKIKNKK